MRSFVRAACISAGVLITAPSALAQTYGGVTFPQGAASFADAVVSYDPAFGGGAVPTAPFQGTANALGIPDYAGNPVCASQAACSFVSLGDGGRIVLRFTNNVLTGSNSTADDLYIFEVGPDVEDTFVDISSNGINWFSVGSVTGSTRGIDIDAFGFGSTSSFSFVRLTDNGDLDSQSGASVGADIDAVGAIATRIVSGVPEPSTWVMLIGGLGAVGRAMRRKARRRGPAALAAAPSS